MSKLDQIRALREARYSTTPAPVAKKAKAEAALASALAPSTPVDKVCGKTGIGGKRCIRELGHSEKNHKYAAVPKS